MSTARWWNPNADLYGGARAIDRLFDQIFGPGAQGPQGAEGIPTYSLPVDVLETEDAYLLHASVPGIPADKVDVTFEDGVLAITAEAQRDESEGRWLRQERPWGNWARKMELPKEIEPSAIEATFENGVLTVTVPKAAKAQPVRIPVGTGTSAAKPVQGS
jgi:HSP20 family protein